jgi:uncharacterized membrane protein
MKADIATTFETAPTGASAQRPSWLRPKYLLFAFIGLMYVYVLWHNERFLINPADPEWPHIAPFKWILLPHGLAAACALILGPFQFSERLRRRFAKLHRVMGRFYVAGCLIGAPIGIYIQNFNTVHLYNNDPVEFSLTIVSVFQAGIWIFCTLMALAFILQRKVQLHRQWMTRSFACAIIFLEVRVVAGVFNLDPRFIEIIVWSCVAAAVPLADLVLYVEEVLRTRAVAAKASRAVTQAA